jgi:hypothetical protein
MRRLLTAAILATLTHAAFAGDITLYSDSDFRGQSVTLDSDTPSLSDVDFNDRASSILVTTGTWQVCEHADFSGRCEEFGPGEYRELSGFNDVASSVRQIDGDGHDRRRDRDGRRGRDRGGSVQLFPGSSFDGLLVGLGDDVRSLNDLDFNDRTNSIIVYEGRWEFCEHDDYRGECIVLGPGQYDDLGTLKDNISSVRQVR